MSQPNTPNNQSSGGLNFTSWLEVLSFLFRTKEGRVLTSVLATVLVTGVVAVAYLMRPNRVEITTGVGTITVKNGDTKNSVFLLSPAGADRNTPWVTTGIQVKKGDKVKMTASGRVHTSMRRLVAESLSPETINSTYLPWVGPAGLNRSEDFALQAARNSYKLLPDTKQAYYGYGMLLAGVKTPKEQIDGIEPIGNSQEFQVNDDGELVLTVNDIWLNNDMKDIYVLPFDKNFEYYKNDAQFQAMTLGEDPSLWSKKTEIERAKKEYQKRLRSWNAIVKNKAWNIWYEDNIGSFSVSITVN